MATTNLTLKIHSKPKGIIPALGKVYMNNTGNVLICCEHNDSVGTMVFIDLADGQTYLRGDVVLTQEYDTELEYSETSVHSTRRDFETASYYRDRFGNLYFMSICGMVRFMSGAIIHPDDVIGNYYKVIKLNIHCKA